MPGFGALENSVYALALAGLTFFYGLDRLVLTSPRVSHTDTSLIFWLHIAAYALLNAIFGYMLLSLGSDSLRQTLIFFVAVALHFLIVDRALREHHKTLYDRQGRWLLTGAIVAGAIAATLTQLNALAIALTGAFLSGSTILNILKRELPDPQQSCFWSFLGGATLYTGLLWLS
ncbi:MAG TPA: hypothetical protein VLS96_16115 [Nodosilinea sp.]|nr:hypothetical protein [Nodosilinea sp.]